MLAATILDDFVLHRYHPFWENIDYTSKRNIPVLQLHACWKENSGLRAAKALSEVDPRRLENISWRKWNKQLWHLAELPPSAINWNKDQDITWLYGPKYLAITYQRDDERPLLVMPEDALASDAEGVPELEADDNSSVISESSARLCGADAVNGGYYHLKPALKETGHPFKSDKYLSAEKKRRKSVKFNYIVNSREIVNGYKFDYDILDALCL